MKLLGGLIKLEEVYGSFPFFLPAVAWNEVMMAGAPVTVLEHADGVIFPCRVKQKAVPSGTLSLEKPGLEHYESVGLCGFSHRFLGL